MNKEGELTIEENLDVIESSSRALRAFIDGLTAGATLQGLDKDEVYSVSKMYASASNIGCYCANIRELIKKDASKGVGEWMK